MTVSESHGATDEDEQRGRRALRRVQVASGLGAAATLVAGRLLLSAGAIPSPYSGDPLPRWRQDAGDVAMVLAVLLLVVGAVVAWRAGMRPFHPPTGIWSLRRGQYRQAARSVRCGAEVPPDQVVVTRLVAASMSRQVKGLLLFAALPLELAALAVQMTNVWWAALTWLGVALMVAGMLYAGRDGHLARRWLHAHPDETTSEATSH